MSGTKAGNVQGEIQPRQIAPTENPPSYNDATRAAAPTIDRPMSKPVGSHCPNLPPPGTDVPLQPLAKTGSYPTGSNQPPCPNPYPTGPITQPDDNLPYDNVSSSNVNTQRPAPTQVPVVQNPSSEEYNYPKNYAIVPDDQEQSRRNSDNPKCCIRRKCLSCWYCCLGMCVCIPPWSLYCLWDDDD